MEAGAECAARKRKAGSGSVNGLEVSVVRAVAAVDREDERARADECSGFEGKTMMRGEREGSGQRAAYATAPDARQDVRQRVGVMSRMWEAARGGLQVVSGVECYGEVGSDGPAFPCLGEGGRKKTYLHSS